MRNHQVWLSCLLLSLSSSIGIAHAQFLGGAPQRQVTAAPALEASSEEVNMLLNAPSPPLLMGPGDAVEVQVYEVEKYSYKTRLDSRGTISLPLIDTVVLQGLTAEQAEALIAERLQSLGMIKTPHVHITISEQPSQVFTVGGEVSRPGAFPAYGPHTLINAISQAGGFKETSSRNVTLLRAGAVQGYTLDLGSDPAASPASSIQVYRGDSVIVGTLGVVYVVGAVRASGIFKMKNTTPTTVFEAVTMAGGAGFEADWNSTQIVRTLDGKRVQIPIDLKRIMHGTQIDPVLQADDIVFVPSNAMKAALKAGGAGLALTLATALIYR